MTYVIGTACVDVMDKSCVQECPVDCIYQVPGQCISIPMSAWTALLASRFAVSRRFTGRAICPTISKNTSTDNALAAQNNGWDDAYRVDTSRGLDHSVLLAQNVWRQAI
jgi:hypothetical protein